MVDNRTFTKGLYHIIHTGANAVLEINSYWRRITMIKRTVHSFCLHLAHCKSFLTLASILYFPIAHNPLCLAPKFCINYCCDMLLGGLHIPKSISQQMQSELWAIGKYRMQEPLSVILCYSCKGLRADYLHTISTELNKARRVLLWRLLHFW